MKNIYRHTLLIVISIFIVSCADINSVHQKWLDEGEKIYVGKLDSLYVRSGMFRAEIVGDNKYLWNATTCSVEYNGKVIEYNLSDVTSDDGKVRLMIPEIERGSYYFNVMTFDAEGNTSIVSEVFGKVYGEEDGLLHLPRRIAEFIPKADMSIDLIWNSAEVSSTRLTYEQNDGTLVTIDVPSNDNMTHIPSWKMGGYIKIESLVKENEHDLDCIPLKTVEMAFPAELPKSTPLFGQNSKMNLGSTADWELAKGFTIEMMVKYNELGAYVQNVISAECSTGGLIVRNNNSKLEYYIHDGGWNGIFYSDLKKDTWYHFAFVYSPNGNTSLYINGEVIGSKPCKVLGPVNEILQIGTSPLHAGQYLRGNVQHVSVWSYARTADEIRKDMSFGFTGEEQGLRAYWPLTTNFGSEVPDITGNHTAVFSDVTWIRDN